MRLIYIQKILILTLVFIVSCKPPTSDWLVYYGSELNPAQLKSIQVAIVDPDLIDPKKLPSSKTKLIAYISVGEAETYRSYWNLMKTYPELVIEKNPNWPDNYLVDVRDGRWQNLILDDLIPRYIQMGFTGVFLDTIDVPIEMERRDPSRFSQSMNGLINVIQEIRRRFPQLIIIPNNGLPILPDIQNTIDGIVVEDLYTRYNFQTKQAEPTPTVESQDKESKLLLFAQQTHKPVYVILYDHSPDTELIRSAKIKCRQNHFKCFVASVDLKSIMEQN